jgi:hypothetical protein
MLQNKITFPACRSDGKQAGVSLLAAGKLPSSVLHSTSLRLLASRQVQDDSTLLIE